MCQGKSRAKRGTLQLTKSFYVNLSFVHGIILFELLSFYKGKMKRKKRLTKVWNLAWGDMVNVTWWHDNKWGMQSRSYGLCLLSAELDQEGQDGDAWNPPHWSQWKTWGWGRREACVPEVKKQAQHMQWRDDLRMFYPKWKAKNTKTQSSKPCQIQLGLVWSGYVTAEAAIYSFLFFFFNWRIFALQCCIGFWYTTTQTSYKYIYVSLPLEPPTHPTPLGCHRAISLTEADEPTVCYSEWSKLEREIQISYNETYIWNLEKWYRWNYLQGRNRDADVENRIVHTVGKEKGGTNLQPSGCCFNSLLRLL